MKRSEINQILRDAEAFMREQQFYLPPFAFWRPAQWQNKGHDCDEIRDMMLGWDITDFGSGRFYQVGLLLFTLRNGRLPLQPGGKTYAEKIMVVREEQVTPMHFHFQKMEDIINRGGGNLLIEVYNATDDDQLANTPVLVTRDGCRDEVAAGTILRLEPGQSITLPVRQYHRFWGEQGHGTVLVGEVSMVNDDNTDNRFYEPAGRFPGITEDEAPLHLLCNEYPQARS